MTHNEKSVLAGVLIIVALLTLFIGVPYLMNSIFPLLQPAGEIALDERNLMFFAVGVMLLIVIPTISLIFYFAYKYRSSNSTVSRDSEPHENPKHEFFWWLIPSSVILILAIFGWHATHALDPFKPIEAGKKPITVQVIALNWKWLFIYPEQNIATVNELRIPVGTPVHFLLTADGAPMNSFWIPQLGGQMYTMTGMSTELNLIANRPGIYDGSAAEINGSGFAGMRFKAIATNDEDFTSWVSSAKQSNQQLMMGDYEKLKIPSENVAPATYRMVDDNLYNIVIAQYMPPPKDGVMEGMDMNSIQITNPL